MNWSPNKFSTQPTCNRLFLRFSMEFWNLEPGPHQLGLIEHRFNAVFFIEGVPSKKDTPPSLKKLLRKTQFRKGRKVRLREKGKCLREAGFSYCPMSKVLQTRNGFFSNLFFCYMFLATRWEVSLFLSGHPLLAFNCAYHLVGVSVTELVVCFFS